jgi:hypothetical protein
VIIVVLASFGLFVSVVEIPIQEMSPVSIIDKTMGICLPRL